MVTLAQAVTSMSEHIDSPSDAPWEQNQRSVSPKNIYIEVSEPGRIFGFAPSRGERHWLLLVKMCIEELHKNMTNTEYKSDKYGKLRELIAFREQSI